MKLYNEEISPEINKEPLFFGTGRTLQRYDEIKYEAFEDISEDMLENFWKKQEVKLLKDYNDHSAADNVTKRVFTLNIKRQSVLDTIQGRSLLATIGRVVTNSELEKALTILQQQEVNHSDTYTYILRNVYDNPSEVFEEINEDVIITRHAKKIKQIYEDLYDILAKWEYEEYLKLNNPIQYYIMKTLKMITPLDDVKKLIFKAIIAWNIIEGVRFFVSFACTFKFAENKIYTGNAQELKLIARDELTHLRISQKVIRILKNVESEGFIEITKELELFVMDMFKEAAEDEIEWIYYLFRDGTIKGLNINILIRYMKHITNVRTRNIGYPKVFDSKECEDLPYMQKWLGGEAVVELPQEIDSTSYKIAKTIPMDELDWALLK